MKYLSLLLIPLLLFMTSCTIDWNDEKDKKIAELERQIQNDTFKKKQECKETKFSFEGLEKYEKVYSKKFNTCYAIGKKMTNNEILYGIRDIYTNNYTFRIVFNSSGSLLREKSIGVENKILEEGIDIEKRAKCEFNKMLKNIKGDDYQNHTDFISINCD